jgi:hypothetical protein
MAESLREQDKEVKVVKMKGWGEEMKYEVRGCKESFRIVKVVWAGKSKTITDCLSAIYSTFLHSIKY